MHACLVYNHTNTQYIHNYIHTNKQKSCTHACINIPKNICTTKTTKDCGDILVPHFVL